MLEEEFRKWLGARGVSSKSIDTRTYAVQNIERNLEQLGFEQPDLDTIIRDDEFSNLIKRISGLRQDAQNGGTSFRILLPQSDSPEKRLASWKNWLGQYEKFVDADVEIPDTNYDEQYAIWDEFLELWPLERLKKMNLPEYSKAGDQNTFSYWIEARLERMGSIWGGSAFKFGVYSRKDTDDKLNSSGRSYSTDYGWYTKLGASSEEAFENVREAIVNICEAASSGNLAIIKNEKRLGSSMKWKIAFHYQNRDNPTIINIFKKKCIQDYLSDTENRSLDVLHPVMMSNKPDEQGVLEYGADVWSRILSQQQEKIEVSVENETSDEKTLPINLIFYGPPGTGKTYRTAAEALRLCGATVPGSRDEIMELYNALSKDGRIRFITFHQNFSYEEFVEGLRPETGESEAEDSSGTGFRLDPRPGIFRELCAVAEEARKRPVNIDDNFDLDGRKFWKMSLGHIGSQDSVYEAAMADEYIALGWGRDVDWSDARFSSQDAIRDEWHKEPRDDDRPSNVTQLHPFRNTMKIGDIVVIPFGNKAFRAVGEVTGEYYFERDGEPTYYHRRKVKWLFVPDEPLPLDTIIDGDFQMRSFYSIATNRVNREALVRLIGGSDDNSITGDSTGDIQQFVLIIDEINRANVSKVFGELITLIEPDKRLGMPNALKVRLPYSKREFGVPANLHIIGTMNTADRSISQLDTALRRRFQFVELAPDPSVTEFKKAEEDTGLPLTNVLNNMNRRIEYLVDRDHRIGHAFFIGCKKRKAVDAVMRDKVIPLLQEYFFDDWNRLAAVLGEKDKGGDFLECDIIEDPMGEGGEPLKSWRVRKVFHNDAYDRLALGDAPLVMPMTEKNENG